MDAPEGTASQTETHCATVPSSDNEVLKKAVTEMFEVMREENDRLIKGIAGKRVGGVSNETSSPSPSSLGMPGEAAHTPSASSLRRGNAQDVIQEEACVQSAPKILGSTRSTTLPGSADHQYSGEATTSRVPPVKKKAPPTHQQPARAARRK